MSPLTALAYVGVAFAAVFLLIAVWVVIGAARISLDRTRSDKRGGLLEYDTPEARKAVGKPW